MAKISEQRKGMFAHASLNLQVQVLHQFLAEHTSYDSRNIASFDLSVVTNSEIRSDTTLPCRIRI